MALLIEGIIFFPEGRYHAPSQKKSSLDDATPKGIELLHFIFIDGLVMNVHH